MPGGENLLPGIALVFGCVVKTVEHVLAFHPSAEHFQAGMLAAFHLGQPLTARREIPGITWRPVRLLADDVLAANPGTGCVLFCRGPVCAVGVQVRHLALELGVEVPDDGMRLRLSCPVLAMAVREGGTTIPSRIVVGLGTGFGGLAVRGGVAWMPGGALGARYAVGAAGVVRPGARRVRGHGQLSSTHDV
jgi:hypothetical protein